jgi:hypothetical protein
VLKPFTGNCTVEAISDPTPEDVTAFVSKLAPRLRSRLTTPTAAKQFLDEITVILSVAPAKKGGSLLAA